MNTRSKNLSKTLGTLCILGVVLSYGVIGFGLRTQKEKLMKIGAAGVVGSIPIGLAALITATKEND